ncbi:MAG: hypothetical protein AAGA23_21070 [Pseudomonadota bacterium]
MLASLIDRSRVTSALLVSLGIGIPMGLVLSGAVVSLATLRRGATDGVVVAIGGLAVFVALTAFAGFAPGSGALTPAAFMAASIVIAVGLRNTRSLAFAVWMAVAATLTWLLAFWLSVTSPAEYWRGLFEQLIRSFSETGQVEFAAQLKALSEKIAWRGVTGQVFGTLFVLLALALFWGRSWHARLANPGGFQAEFHELELGRLGALTAAALFMAAAATGHELVLSAAAIMLYVWLVPAFALIHWQVKRRELGSGWLWAAYLVCVFSLGGNNMIFLAFPLVGMLNEFLSFRRGPGKPGAGQS